jgi:hypothetical protein
MLFSMQCWTEFGNFSNPYSQEDDVFIGTLAQCKAEFAAWRDMHLSYYDLKDLISYRDSPGICANVYNGKEIGDYPDFQLILGKRGAVKVGLT